MNHNPIYFILEAFPFGIDEFVVPCGAGSATPTAGLWTAVLLLRFDEHQLAADWVAEDFADPVITAAAVDES